MHVHKSYDTLYEFIPRGVLPKDLGGNEKSLKELAGTTIGELEQIIFYNLFVFRNTTKVF